MLPSPFRLLPFVLLVLVVCFSVDGKVLVKHANRRLALNPLQVSKEDRRTVVSTDAGRVTAVDVNDGYNSTYHLQFITMEPSSIFLPVILQSDMIIYVHTGRGKLSWADEDEVQHVNLERGDIYRLESGSVFYMQSNPDPIRIKLRVYAFFSTFTDENAPESFVGAYSTLSDLVFGFDRDVLQMAFKVPEVIVDEILKARKPPMIVPSESSSETEEPDWKEQMIEELLRGSTESLQDLTNKKKDKDKKKKSSTFNVFSSKPDFQNCNGWSLAVTNKDFKALRDSNIGVIAVNLNKGSMMGPHWNPRATEVAIVTQGQGMVRVICPSEAAKCKSSRFMVGEGDVFVVPRYHPMAQMSFNNDSFAFVGFSTRAMYNRPQFLAGKSSVLRALDVSILAKTFNVSNTTMNQLLGQRTDSIILDCTSCAEEELRKMEEGEERGPEEEGEEEERRPEEEEERRRKKEEEERRREEEEEGRGGREKEEEERRRREEEGGGRGGREEKEEERRRREEEEEEEEEEERRGGREEEEGEEKGGEEEGRGEEEEERGGGGGERRRKWKKVWRV